MTDKQIIDLTEIDKKYKDKCSLIKAGKCKNVNIFIEQSRKLKAKEQECEDLKEDKELWKSNFEGMVGAIEDLSHQLDQLKVEIEQEKALKETYLTCYKAKHEDIEGVLFKLKQTPAEIKEIAKQFCNACQEFEPEKRGSNCIYCNYGKILQKIKEYKVEE